MKKTMMMAVLAAGVAATQVQAQAVSWNFAQLSRASAKIDDESEKLTGISAAFSREMKDNIVLGGEYMNMDFSKYGWDVKVKTIELHAGRHHSLSGSAQWYWQAGLANQSQKTTNSWWSSRNESDSAMFVNGRVGLIGMTTDALQLNGFVEYQYSTDSEFDSDIWVGAQARYYINSAFSLQTSYGIGDDIRLLTFGAAYHF